MRKPLQPGEIVKFSYHCLESEKSADAELWHRTKQQVTVLFRLPASRVDEEQVGPMYRIKFADGFEGDAFNDEVRRLPIPSGK